MAVCMVQSLRHIV